MRSAPEPCVLRNRRGNIDTCDRSPPDRTDCAIAEANQRDRIQEEARRALSKRLARRAM